VHLLAEALTIAASTSDDDGFVKLIDIDPDHVIG
jgi:hypothetical protein